MNKYRQARYNRKTRPRPKNTAARGWNAFINALFFCVWNYPSVNKEDVYMLSVQEPILESVTGDKTKPVNREKHGQIFFNKTNHEPRQSSNKDGGKAKKSFQWPWSKKKDEEKKIKIEVLTETFVHLDGFGGHGGPAVKDQDCVHLSQSGCTKLSVSSTSEASTSNMPQQLSLESIKSQDELSAAAIDSIVSSLSSDNETQKKSLSMIFEGSLKSISIASIASSLTSIGVKKHQLKDKVENKWGPLPISGSASSFDGNSTSFSEDNVSPLEDKQESYANVPRGVMHEVSIVLEEMLKSICLASNEEGVPHEDRLQNDDKEDVPDESIPDVYTLIKRTLNLVVPKTATPSSSGTEIDLSEKLATPGSDGDATGSVHEHKNPSLHKLHTEWLPEDHENVEVLLRLKEKISRESIADDEIQSADRCDLPDARHGEDEEKSGAAPEAEVQSVKMDETDGVDSGIASGKPSEITQE